MCRIHTAHTCIHADKQTTDTDRPCPILPIPRTVYIHIPHPSNTYVSTLYPHSLDLESSFFSSFDRSQLTYIYFISSVRHVSSAAIDRATRPGQGRDSIECFFFFFDTNALHSRVLRLDGLQYTKLMSWTELNQADVVLLVHSCIWTWNTCRCPGTRRSVCVCLPDYTTIVVKPGSRRRGWINGDFNILVVLSCLGLFRIQCINNACQ